MMINSSAERNRDLNIELRLFTVHEMEGRRRREGEGGEEKEGRRPPHSETSFNFLSFPVFCECFALFGSFKITDWLIK